MNPTQAVADAHTPFTLAQRLSAVPADRLRGMRRGIEKESLRSLPTGALALTPHPASLGSALTHPHITTDFSESQVELVTGVHASVEAALQELTDIHQFTYRMLAKEDDEMLWASSMPCSLPVDESIPIARFGSSNIGQAKSVYRMGLSHRYGRRMQTISGIHYNWSLPSVSSAQYFSLIRNFRRHAFLLLVLFGASPAVCSSFVAGRQHALERLTDHTLYMPHGTSLRMGRLGYQSDAQASLAVSYNSLDGYAASLQEALTKSYPPYEAVGVRKPSGEYNQLATTLLQIENEFYGTIRPKRVIFPGERPLHALRERGVEYVEVRLMDLDPFEPVGISASTMRFLDVFLLHCLLTDSPPDTETEIAELGRNQHRTAARGRKPGLTLERAGVEVPLLDWSRELLQGCMEIALATDSALGGGQYRAACEIALTRLETPDLLPSARVLAAMESSYQRSHLRFSADRSLIARQWVQALPYGESTQARFEALTAESLAEQARIEASDSMLFENYRQNYLKPERLRLRGVSGASA